MSLLFLFDEREVDNGLMKEIINFIQNYWLSVFTLISIFIEITPIKINPISSLLKWIGSQINKDIKEQLTEQNQKLDVLQEKHENTESRLDNIELNNMRSRILDFANSVMRERKHTQEEFNYIFKLHSDYEELIKEKRYPNKQLDNAISYIDEIYNQCLRENSFLK